MEYKKPERAQGKCTSRKKAPFGPPMQPEMSSNINSENSRVLAEIWDDLICPKKRLETHGRFLLKKLGWNNCSSIFDACLGTGADALYLLEHGHEVFTQGFDRIVGNEIDAHFRSIALAKAREKGADLAITAYDWRELGKYRDNFGSMVTTLGFDAILCMGNSLTYMFSREDQMRVLGNFKALLKEQNGLLFIDTRNYDYMRRHRNEILSDRKNFRYSSKYVYCGTDRVSIAPVKISDDELVMEYVHLHSGKVGYLTLYPFGTSEFVDLLLKTGFSEIKVFSDYVPGIRRDADFYQFICVKSPAD